MSQKCQERTHASQQEGLFDQLVSASEQLRWQLFVCQHNAPLDPGAETVGALPHKESQMIHPTRHLSGSALSEEISQPLAAIHLHKLAPSGHLSLATIEIQI
jgi:hypothetical protein